MTSDESRDIFLNRQIDLATIPSAEQIDYAPLNPNYLTLLIISVVISNIVLLIVSFIGTQIAGLALWISLAAVGFWILICAVQLFVVTKGFRFKGFAIRQRDVAYKTGWIYKKLTVIPYSRIQHVDVKQGLFERMYGLGKLNVYTAGGQGSDLTIPGLTFEEAQRMKSFILGIMESDEEE